ncbi:MAG: hypothetical protein NVS9B10_01850 [Nevskia sp.]
MPAEVRIDLVNPWGSDGPVDWRRGLLPPEAPGHAPINYWAWPAATGGRAHQTLDTILEAGDARPDAIVVLLRKRGRLNLRAVRRLKARGLRVFVSWKESGRHQIADQLYWPWQRSALRRVLAMADGAISPTESGLQHLLDHGLPAARAHFIPTPYPFDEAGWDFSLPLAQRRGLLVGTRQFDLPWRRHTEALQLAGRIARATGCPVTAFNLDGPRGRARVQALLGAVPDLRWLEQRLPYTPYLREMARHRLVVQRDAGSVPGQVAGDALLCGLVNVGGDGAVQRLAFPDTSEPEHDAESLFASAVRLLGDDAYYLAEAAAARERAGSNGLSFASSRARLSQLVSGPAPA